MHAAKQKKSWLALGRRAQAHSRHVALCAIYVGPCSLCARSSGPGVTCRSFWMAAPKIKKKSSSAKTSPVPRQGAIPCLIVVALILIAAVVLLYYSLRNTGW